MGLSLNELSKWIYLNDCSEKTFSDTHTLHYREWWTSEQHRTQSIQITQGETSSP